MGTLYNSFINSKDMGAMMDVGGPITHYIEDGSGPPMLFLHGLGFSLFTFRRNYPFFARTMRILAADLPGCGYSRLPGNYGGTTEDMAKYLKSFLDGAKATQAVVCGAGEGGIYALELALRHPEKVSALILSSPGSLTRHFPKHIRQFLNPVMGELRINAMNSAHMQQFMKWCYFNEINVDRYVVKQVYQPFENRMARHVLLKILKDYDDRYVHENLEKIKCPTLIIWGDGDAGRPAGMAQMYEKAIPNSTVQIIRNCGMLPHEEKHREFNGIAEQFLVSILPELKGINGASQSIDFMSTDYSDHETNDGQEPYDYYE